MRKRNVLVCIVHDVANTLYILKICDDVLPLLKPGRSANTAGPNKLDRTVSSTWLEPLAWCGRFYATANNYFMKVVFTTGHECLQAHNVQGILNSLYYPTTWYGLQLHGNLCLWLYLMSLNRERDCLSVEVATRSCSNNERQFCIYILLKDWLPSSAKPLTSNALNASNLSSLYTLILYFGMSVWNFPGSKTKNNLIKLFKVSIHPILSTEDLTAYIWTTVSRTEGAQALSPEAHHG